MTLGELKPNKAGIVIKIEGQGVIKRRLFDMGITPGTKIAVRKMAPLGDPMEIELRGYVMGIRKEEANKIIIEEVSL
ncbi:MAG TPA: ferrous iron transport protein A [Bacilli bacterium]|nr:ferrous iron transport protein A [Bacilli bacterium]